MIHFMRNGDKDCKTVWVRVDLPSFNIEEPRAWFSFDCSDPIYAVLLVNQLEKQYHEAVTKARSEAYEKGYTDGKGRKRKEKIFSPCLYLRSPCRK